jgi:hypothetical protein
MILKFYDGISYALISLLLSTGFLPIYYPLFIYTVPTELAALPAAVCKVIRPFFFLLCRM